MATHSNILVWEIPWQRSLVGYSPWGGRVGHDWARAHTCAHTHTHIIVVNKSVNWGILLCLSFLFFWLLSGFEESSDTLVSWKLWGWDRWTVGTDGPFPVCSNHPTSLLRFNVSCLVLAASLWTHCFWKLLILVGLHGMQDQRYRVCVLQGSSEPSIIFPSQDHGKMLNAVPYH